MERGHGSRHDDSVRRPGERILKGERHERTRENQDGQGDGEFIARQINDEGVFEGWLIGGVADGDIKYGDLKVRDEDREDLAVYIEDESFADLMHTFLYVMSRARRSGGLYCDQVVDKEGD